MKLPTLLGLLGLRKDVRRIAVALESIAHSQRRLADLEEGILPLRESPPDAPIPPATLDTLTHPPGWFEQIEQVEQWFLAQHHRMPSVEEILREIDAIPHDAAEAEEAWRKKWARVRTREATS